MCCIKLNNDSNKAYSSLQLIITGPAQHLASDITGSITKRDLQRLRLVLTDLFRDNALLEILEATIIATSIRASKESSCGDDLHQYYLNHIKFNTTTC